MAYMQTNRDNNGASENIIMGLNKPAYAYYRFIAADRYEPTQSSKHSFRNIYSSRRDLYVFSYGESRSTQPLQIKYTGNGEIPA